MVESDLLDGRLVNTNGANNYLIEDITPMGHEFLGNIRSNENWQKTKSIASKVGAATLDVFSKIAVKLVSDSITQNMLNN